MSRWRHVIYEFLNAWSTGVYISFVPRFFLRLFTEKSWERAWKRPSLQTSCFGSVTIVVFSRPAASTELKVLHSVNGCCGIKRLLWTRTNYNNHKICPRRSWSNSNRLVSGYPSFWSVKWLELLSPPSHGMSVHRTWPPLPFADYREKYIYNFFAFSPAPSFLHQTLVVFS